jgi:hypothetical protein
MTTFAWKVNYLGADYHELDSLLKIWVLLYQLKIRDMVVLICDVTLLKI